MKPRRILWSAAALLLILGGFIVDRTVLDDSNDDIGVEQDAGDRDARDQESDTSSDDEDEAEPDEIGDGYVAFSDLPTVTLDELSPEAIEVLQLIEDGGPYEYRQDDSVFQNREGILPDRESGHYREYTVETPGSPDRGALRIVAGADGERYWTDDHYDSFYEIEF